MTNERPPAKAPDATYPDGTYAEWGGRVYRASGVTRPPHSLRLWTDDPDRLAEGFEEAKPGQFWKLVPKSELTGLFSLRTFCRWKGERCRVIERNQNGSLQLQLEKVNEPLARELGFEPTYERGVFTTVVLPSEVTDLHQERSEIPLA